MRRIVATLFSFLLVAAAHAQSTMVQGGPWTPGHAPMYVPPAYGTPVLQDSGPAGGGGNGVGFSEQLLTERGTGTPPYVNAGTGPLGTNWCDYDAPITNATGYHYLCFGPNAQGGGLIAYGAGGAASQLPLQVEINGIKYPFPGTGSGNVLGPTSTTVGDLAVWNNTAGTLLKDVPYNSTLQFDDNKLGVVTVAIPIWTQPGIDCTGAFDSSTGLNTLFSNITGKHVQFLSGQTPCQLKVTSPLVIQGQEGWWLDGGSVGGSGTGVAIIGCGGTAGPVLYVNRSGLWKMSGFDIEAEGAGCSAGFTQSLQIDNSGSGGFTTTNTSIEQMAFSTNWNGTHVSNYIAINDTAQPNGESFRVRDSVINCQFSTNSDGIRLAGENQDNGEINHNSIAGCYRGIHTQGGSPKILNNQMGENANYSVFGVGGGDIYIESGPDSICASPPIVIQNNELADGGPPIASGTEGCFYLDIIGNTIGAPDVAPEVLPIDVGNRGGVYTVIGNVVNFWPTSGTPMIGDAGASGGLPAGILYAYGNTNEYGPITDPTKPFQLGSVLDSSTTQDRMYLPFGNNLLSGGGTNRSSASYYTAVANGYINPDLFAQYNNYGQMTISHTAGAGAGIMAIGPTLIGNVSVSSMGAITPTPNGSPLGAPGSTSYSYKEVAIGSGACHLLPSTALTITNGNAVLSTTNKNNLSLSAISGAIAFNIYRTASAGTPSSTGLIGTVDLSSVSNESQFQFFDTGLAGDGSPPPTTNTCDGEGNFAGPVKTSAGYTIASGSSQLPIAGIAGRRAYVIDQATSCPSPGSALTGSGSVVCPVFDNGTAWVGD